MDLEANWLRNERMAHVRYRLLKCLHNGCYFVREVLCDLQAVGYKKHEQKNKLYCYWIIDVRRRYLGYIAAGRLVALFSRGRAY